MMRADYDVIVADTRDDEELVQFGVRLPKSMLAELDAEAREIVPRGLPIRRSDIVRLALREWLDARKQAKRGNK